MHYRQLTLAGRLALTGLLFFYCDPASAQFTTSDFKNLSSLAGVWAMPQDDGMLYEVWEKRGDTLMLGRSYSVRDRDTVQEETIRLSLKDGIINYSPVLARHKSRKPVHFRLKSINDSGFVFENKKHDFPKRIQYRLEGDTLHALISGRKKDKREKRFRYSKVIPPDNRHALGYFAGHWQIRAWFTSTPAGSPPDIRATWQLDGALNNDLCLLGFVQLSNGSIFTREMIAYDPAKDVFVRTIAAADSSYFTFTSKGWEDDRLIWKGTQSASNGTATRLKQEIFRKDKNSFSADYYMRKKGTWRLIMREELERIIE